MEDGEAGVPGGGLSERVADGASRKRFMQMVGGAGAASAFAALVAGCGSGSKDDKSKIGTNDPGTQGASDLAIVQYALLLELIEADFYEKVIASGEVKDPTFAEMAKQIGENEQEHVDALSGVVKQLGSPATEKPKTKFDSVLAGGEAKILATAAMVENVGASAYLGQADKIMGEDILNAALAIHTVEARHAAALNDLAGNGLRASGEFIGAVPDGAFAKPKTMDEVMKLVKPFIA